MRLMIMVDVLVLLLLMLCADSSCCCARQILAPGSSTVIRISAATATTTKAPWDSDRGAKAAHIGDLVISLAENGIDVCGGGRHGS